MLNDFFFPEYDLTKIKKKLKADEFLRWIYPKSLVTFQLESFACSGKPSS